MRFFFSDIFLSILLFGWGQAAQCDDAEGQLLAATKRLEQGNLEEAKAIFVEVQRSHPQCNKTLLGLGRIAAAQGDGAEAARFFTQFKDAAPTDPLGYYHLAE